MSASRPMATSMTVFLGVKLVLWLACLVVAMVKPEGGIHDDLARTRLVPR